MTIIELKRNGSGNGFDAIGFRRRGNQVDLYKFEFKQVTSAVPPKLGGSEAGIQLGFDWSADNLRKLFQSSDPVAFETEDALRKVLKKYFGNKYSEELLFQALEHQLPKAKAFIVTRAHANLEKLIPQMFEVAKRVGKSNVHLLLVKGRK